MTQVSTSKRSSLQFNVHKKTYALLTAKVLKCNKLALKYRNYNKKRNYCGGSYIVILNIFISYMCLAKYGASEAIYLCKVVEKIHQYLRPKMRQILENKISCSLTVQCTLFPVATLCTLYIRFFQNIDENSSIATYGSKNQKTTKPKHFIIEKSQQVYVVQYQVYN